MSAANDYRDVVLQQVRGGVGFFGTEHGTSSGKVPQSPNIPIPNIFRDHTQSQNKNAG